LNSVCEKVFMYPVLFKFGSLSIYAYGLFVGMGFLLGLYLAKKEAVRVGLDPNRIVDLCFYVLIAAIIGSRLFYGFTRPEIFMHDPVEIFRIWNGGLVFYGGFIAALVTAVAYLKHHALPLWKTADILAPALAAGHFMGRIGCFFAGCCYGRSCDLPWAVTFTRADSLAPQGIPLHPTQLYESLSNLALFGILWAFRKHTRFEGQLFWIYVLLYGVVRSVIERFRGDFRGELFFGVLSPSQFVGIAAALVAVFMLIHLSRKSRIGVRNNPT